MVVTELKSRLFKCLLVIVLLVVMLPEIMRFALVKSLPSMGLGDVAIEDIDLNVFKGSAAVEYLTVTREGVTKLKVDRFTINLSWLQLLLGIINVQEVTLEGVRLAVVQTEDGGWEVVLPLESGDQTEQITQPSETVALPKVLTDTLQMRDVVIDVKRVDAEGVLSIKQLELTHLNTWLQQPILLALSAAWNNAPITVSAVAKPWDDQPSIKGRLQADRLSLGGLASFIGQSITGDVTLDIDLQAGRNQQGDIDAVLSGSFLLDQLAASYQQLAFNNQSFEWQGQLTLAMLKEHLNYQLQGDVALADLAIIDQQQQLDLLAWKSLSLKDLSLDQQLNLSMEAFTINELDAIKVKNVAQGKFYAGRVLLDSVVLQEGRRLSIDHVNLSDSQSHVVITSEGALEVESVLASVLARLAPSPKADDESPDSTELTSRADTVEPFSINLKQFDLTGDSRLQFSDLRFDVPVKQTLNIQSFVVNNINQQQVDQPAHIDLVASLGEFSPVKLQGELKPFANPLAIAIKGDMKAIDLHSISAYTEASLGYHITRGQYDHEFDLNIANDMISLDNKLHLRQLLVKSVDDSKPQPMARQLTMPLGMALDMLRDSDDNIELDVPIKGRMDDPNINVSNVINDALGGAIKNGAASFLKLTLQPYGAALVAANLIGEQLSAVRLEPMIFSAGSSELSNEHRDYAHKIVQILHKRPKLNLTLCGKANDADQESLQLLQPEKPVTDEELHLLAGHRAERLKGLMVEQSIEGNRLFLCQPVYEADGEPSVALTI